MLPAQRLQFIKEYYFSEKLREVQQLRAAGKPIVNLGIGSPDLQPPTGVLKALEKTVFQNENGYQPYKGIPALRNAMATFYKNHYQVSLDADTAILPLTGSKEGIIHLTQAFVNPGDEVLIPNPGYATYTSATHLAQAKPIYFDLTAKNHWLPDMDALEKLDLTKVKILWLNYPNMPSGAEANEVFFKKIIQFGKKHQIIIAHDNPYSFILTKKPLSILSIAKPTDAVIELNSLSKTFNMAGWRIGMMCGNKEIISEVLKVKSNMDSGMYYGLQMGAITALHIGQKWYEELNSVYTTRKEIMGKIIDTLGYTWEPQTAGFFIWAKLPEHLDDYAIADELLYEKNIFVTPGSIFGSNGKGYIRFSLCISEEILTKVLKQLTT